jgi:ribonuclease G
VTSQVTLAGRYVVLIPFADNITVSKRIHDRREKKRLVDILEEVRPANFGVIVRTAAEGVQNHLIEQDVAYILKRWQEIFNNLSAHRIKLLNEFSKATSLLRDILNETFDYIVVDQKKTYEQLKSYIDSISDGKRKILRLHRDSRKPFEVYGVDKQIKTLFGRVINFGKGAYLVLEHTEAMHVIDVNSGSKTSKDASREENVLNINMDAAEEIARQLRLRDLGGLIVIDFIDMRSQQNQKKLLERMKLLMSTDRAQHSLTSISKFGLMEITRERVKPEIKLSITEICPVCKGSGELKPASLVLDDISNSLSEISAEKLHRKVILKVHPFVAAYLQKGFPSQLMKWMLLYKIRINMVVTEDISVYHYKITDTKGIDLEE